MATPEPPRAPDQRADESIEEYRERKKDEAFPVLSEIARLHPELDISQHVQSIGLFIRDRELHHFEVEQENELLQAEKEQLQRELLATNNYAIVKRGNGWDASFDLITWDEQEKVWTTVETDISKGAALTLRDEYNRKRQA